MQDKKKIVIGALCALVMIMAVGYALLSQQLQITGQANITSNWQVEITNIKEVENIGSGRTISTNYTATTATFNNEVIHTGDKITYEITVTNKGTLDAVLEDYTVSTGDNDAIIVTTDKGKEFYKGLKLTKNGGTNTITLSVQYDPETTIQPANSSNSISVTLNYQQDQGQVSPYDGYEIGDVITFNNTNWRVIKDSSEDEDYVTVMKEKVLTNAELGSYAYDSTSDTMEFTWTEICHNSNHGYSSSSYNCDNTNSYANSKVKEFLEGTYINTLGANKLKEVDGYKIRLITREELNQNLGWSALDKYATDSDNSQIPTWVYTNFGEGQNNVFGYWTMTPHPDYSSYTWYVTRNGQVNKSFGVYYNGSGVRPVINLLKSSIE